MTSPTIHDATDASRLIALGMRPRQIPARDMAYADLVTRYTEDDTFADLVNAIAAGLDLKILGVTTASGAVLAAREDSVFEVRIEEYARRTALSGRGIDKVIHGLAHLAIAALAFPRPDDLANDTYVGRVSVEQVDAVVREACRVLETRSAVAEQNEDPLDTAPDLERAWRAYTRRPEVASTKDGRALPNSTRGIIGKAARYLALQGMLIGVNDEGGGTWRTTPRYQVQVRELAAQAAFAELLALGVVTVTDPTGSLRQPAPTDDSDYLTGDQSDPTSQRGDPAPPMDDLFIGDADGGT
jgi:hypothetical protein